MSQFFDFSKYTQEQMDIAIPIATACFHRNPNYLQRLIHSQGDSLTVKSFVDENGRSCAGDLHGLTYEMLLISCLKYSDKNLKQDKLLLTMAWRRLIEYFIWKKRIKRVEMSEFVKIGRSDITDEYYRHSQILEEINSDDEEELDAGI